MKKCSKSAHATLTELNITPLLDLAFVLLVIFIITTIPPVKDVPLKLPAASKHENDPDLNIIVRGDAQTKYKQIRAVLDVCQQANVPKVDLATEPLKK